MKMKYYALFIGLVVSVSGLTAQNLVYFPTQDYEVTSTDTITKDYQIDITTPVPEAITFQWELVSNTFPSEWECSLCDYDVCYFDIPNSGTMAFISLGDATNFITGLIKLSIKTGIVDTTGTAVFYVYDANDYNRGDTISFTIHSILNVADIAEDYSGVETLIYPNPAQNIVRISNPINSTINVEIYDALGIQVAAQVLVPNQTINRKVVQRETLPAYTDKSQINISNLAGGVYFVRFVSGGFNSTQKLIIE